MQNCCFEGEVDVDVDRARTFLEIIHTGSFLKAADRLHVTQTTVSARIRTLEQSLGNRLFVRSRNGVTLTAAGREFERYAQSFVQVWETTAFRPAGAHQRRRSGWRTQSLESRSARLAGLDEETTS